MSDPRKIWEKYAEYPVCDDLCTSGRPGRTCKVETPPGLIADYTGRGLGKICEKTWNGYDFGINDETELLLLQRNDFDLTGIKVFVNMLYKEEFPFRMQASEVRKLTVVLYENTISKEDFDCMHDQIKKTCDSTLLEKNEILYTKDLSTLRRLQTDLHIS